MIEPPSSLDYLRSTTIDLRLDFISQFSSEASGLKVSQQSGEGNEVVCDKWHAIAWNSAYFRLWCQNEMDDNMVTASF